MKGFIRITKEYYRIVHNTNNTCKNTGGTWKFRKEKKEFGRDIERIIVYKKFYGRNSVPDVELLTYSYILFMGQVSNLFTSSDFS